MFSKRTTCDWLDSCDRVPRSADATAQRVAKPRSEGRKARFRPQAGASQAPHDAANVTLRHGEDRDYWHQQRDTLLALRASTLGRLRSARATGDVAAARLAGQHVQELQIQLGIVKDRLRALTDAKRKGGAA